MNSISPLKIEGMSTFIQKDLKLLSFVKWDRLVQSGVNKTIKVFGWVYRDDSYTDFVLLNYQLKYNRGYWDSQLSFSTSSKEYSEKIAELLEIKSHDTCERVEDYFEISNCIKLKRLS